MPIELLDDGRFHLFTNSTSYVLEPTAYGAVRHLYWGARLNPGTLVQALTESIPHSIGTPDEANVAFHALTLECPFYGSTDYREPMFAVQLANGTTAMDLHYSGYRIIHGKVPLLGLPSLRAEPDDDTETLQINLDDRRSGLRITLQYSVLGNYDVMTRSVLWNNSGSEDIRLTRALSAVLDFDESNFRIMHLSGAWARERGQSWHDLSTPGRLVMESRRGTSSHQEQPALFVVRPDTTLHQGDAYVFHLVYSGSFLGFAQVDEYRRLRIGLGIHPTGFEWGLAPGDSFQSPEVVLRYSPHGLHGISQGLHRVYRERLIQPAWRDHVRPIAINTWEASYFHVDAKSVLELGRQAADLGIELVVIDDGWFARRDNDRSSLGDWVVNPAKFPHGLEPIMDGLKSWGLQVGLWIEPEMVSPDSELYRMHRDWCLYAPGREAPLGRHQLLLDLGQKPVQDWIIETVTDLVARYRLDYLKWDWNRPMAEGGSAGTSAGRQGEVGHRYVLGLYRILETLTRQFPDLLVEGCAGGGGRFDPGMLAFTPQIWPSDNTDAVDRLAIQGNTAWLYPPSSISAHVSAVPNHQTGREVPLTYRNRVAASGVLGYELDLTQLSQAEKELTRQHVQWYKSHRDLILAGEYVPLVVDDASDQAAWMFWNANEGRGIIYWFCRDKKPNQLSQRLVISDLPIHATYEITDQDSGEHFMAHGSELRYRGIPLLRFFGQYKSRVWTIAATSPHGRGLHTMGS